MSCSGAGTFLAMLSSTSNTEAEGAERWISLGLPALRQAWARCESIAMLQIPDVCPMMSSDWYELTSLTSRVTASRVTASSISSIERITRMMFLRFVEFRFRIELVIEDPREAGGVRHTGLYGIHWPC